MEPEGSLQCSQEPHVRPCVTFRNKLYFFYGEELLATRPTSMPEDHPLSAVSDIPKTDVNFQNMSTRTLIFSKTN
jgi:hypothetical protein